MKTLHGTDRPVFYDIKRHYGPRHYLMWAIAAFALAAAAGMALYLCNWG